MEELPTSRRSNVAKQEEPEARFNRPGQGRTKHGLLLPTGVLANELQAVPLSGSERGSRYADIPEIKKRKLELPPSEVRRKGKEGEKRKAQQEAERKERKRIKAEAERSNLRRRGGPHPIEEEEKASSAR